jgi:two-component sensor histidine kinase
VVRCNVSIVRRRGRQRGAGDASNQKLIIQWSESGGPGAHETQHKGFGLNLVTKILADADVELKFERSEAVLFAVFLSASANFAANHQGCEQALDHSRVLATWVKTKFGVGG